MVATLSLQITLARGATTDANAEDGPFRKMLNDMSRYFDGDYSKYPDISYEALANCLSKFDEPVLEAQDGNFQFLYDFYIAEDSLWRPANDTWLEGRGNKSDAIFGGHPDSLGSYSIGEPCNYVSGMSYYK